MPVINLGDEPEKRRDELFKMLKMLGTEMKVSVVSEEEGGSHTKRSGADFSRAIPSADGEIGFAAKSQKFGVAITTVEEGEPTQEEFPGAEVVAVISMQRGAMGLFIDMDADELRKLGASMIATATQMDRGKQALIEDHNG